MSYLRQGATTNHQDARDMYASYGWHISTECAGDVCLQAVEYDWLDQDDAAVVSLLCADDPDLTADEAEEIVARARSVREDMESVESLLGEAVAAYNRRDLQACVCALDDASSAEREHGDDPATTDLRRKLLTDDESEALVREESPLLDAIDDQLIDCAQAIRDGSPELLAYALECARTARAMVARMRTPYTTRGAQLAVRDLLGRKDDETPLRGQERER